jgi:hypothetical protein
VVIVTGLFLVEFGWSEDVGYPTDVQLVGERCREGRSAGVLGADDVDLADTWVGTVPVVGPVDEQHGIGQVSQRAGVSEVSKPGPILDALEGTSVEL